MANANPRCRTLSGDPDQKVEQLSSLAAEWSQLPVIRDMAQGRTIELLLYTVQLLPYVPDPGGGDQVCEPDYVISKGGDCEDRAVLFASLARAKGERVAIVWQSQDGADEDHVTCKLYRNGAWIWADPTVVGARLGEEPHDAVARIGHGAERLR